MLRWLLALPAAFGQDLYENTGLLAEYFAPLPPSETCDPENGSTQVLKERLPNLARRELRLDFLDLNAFKIDRCAWEKDLTGFDLMWSCRGQDELLKNFAARFTGYVYIYVQGYYTFHLDAMDGVRMVLGHDYLGCPFSGLSCASRYDVQNWAMQNMRKNRMNDNSYGNQCDQCAQGIYRDCWVTDYGCEPFSLWQLEGDGGLSGTCSSAGQRQVLESTRWLNQGLHPLRIEYFQRGGTGHLYFKYKGPDTEDLLITVPTSKLGFPRSQNLIKEVFDVTLDNPVNLPVPSLLGDVRKAYPDAQLLYRADDSFIDTGPGEGAFSTEIETLNRPVYIRWHGFFLIVNGGEYLFSLTSDDGGRLTLGGRGQEGERVFVENDGIQEGAGVSQIRLKVQPGLHPIRVEFFWKPSVNPAVTVDRPPGIKVTYNGFDTAGYFLSITRDRAGRISSFDYDCEMRRFSWGNGMSVNRDCKGQCFKDLETMHGDRICDGSDATYNLDCEAYNYDNYDCSPTYPVQLQTTPRPAITCHVSCPSGDFQRKNCGACSRTTADGSLCIEGQDDYCPSGNPAECSFLTCCVAKVTGLNYWGEDCLAFGTASNCSGKLDVILSRIQQTPLALDAAAMYEVRPRPRGQLMSECYSPNCNMITPEFIMNPFTGLLTDQRVCPVQESPELGFECFEGPFDQIGVTDVLTQCQDGRFEWNFCKNRKSIDGRPFTACCSFLYLNSRGTAECQFMGTAQGSCETLLQELERNRSISAYTRIGNQQILKTCSMDSCNNPDDVVAGCPAVVNKEPAITEGLRSTLQPSREDMLQGSQDRPPEPPPWGLIGGLSAVPFVLVCVAMVLSKLGVFKEAIDPLFHSSKAIVVASDTFIEPQRDLIVSGTGVDTKPLAYGRVEPRAVGLKKIQEEEKVLPLALRQKAADAVPEAANAAWVDAVVTEAMVQRETPLLHGTHVLAGTTYTGEGVICLPEELDMPYMERQALALNHPSALSDRTKSYDELTITTQHQAVSVSGAPLSSRMHTSRTSKSGVRTASKLTQRATLTSEYSTDLVAITERTLSQGGTLEEQILHQEALPEPPTELAAPEMGHVEGSISGLVLSPVSVGNLHRPAAAAKRLRKQSDRGAPRVAT